MQRAYRSPLRTLETISTEKLRTALDDADEAKAATRLVVALADTDGVPVSTLVERYGIPRSTTGSIASMIDRWRTSYGTNPARATTEALTGAARRGGHVAGGLAPRRRLRWGGIGY